MRLLRIASYRHLYMGRLETGGGEIVRSCTIKNVRPLLTLVSAILLSACGGDGSSGGQSGAGAAPPTSGGAPVPTPGLGAYQTLAPTPSVSASFEVGGVARISYNGDPATGQIVPNSSLSGLGGIIFSFTYDQPTQTYRFATLDEISREPRTVLFSTPKDAVNPTYSSDKFIGYASQVDGGANAIFRLYRSGTTNPELQLASSGFGEVAKSGPVAHLNFESTWFGYGVPTRFGDVPATGVGTYSGVLYGLGLNPVAGKQYRIEGVTSMSLDYAGRKMSGSVDIVLVAPDGTRAPVEKASFVNGAFFPYADSPAVVDGTLTGPQVPSGQMRASIYGPGGHEIAGMLAVRIILAATGEEITTYGAFAVARR